MDNCPTMTLDFVTSACIFHIVETRICIVCPEKLCGDWTCLTYVSSDWILCIPAEWDALIAMGPSRPPVPALATTCNTLSTLHFTKLEISL